MARPNGEEEAEDSNATAARPGAEAPGRHARSRRAPTPDPLRDLGSGHRRAGRRRADRRAGRRREQRESRDQDDPRAGVSVPQVSGAAANAALLDDDAEPAPEV